MKEIKVRITLQEEMLGMTPANPEIYEQFIASNAPDAATREDEIAEFGVDAVVEKGMTVFPRMEDGTPFLYDYQIKGMFKDVCGMLRRVKGSKSSIVKAYKKEIDGLIFVEPRKIPIQLAGNIGKCQRPLRAMTMQGERVSLAYSESVPAYSVVEFTVKTFLDNEDLILEWLDYGALRGLGQWRNSGKGRFTYEVL